jgi:ribonuclease P protein component
MRPAHGLASSQRRSPSSHCLGAGLTLVQKFFRRAVDRNLMRRRMRVVFRTNKSAWPERVDIVVVMQPSALEASFQELESDMLTWGQGSKALGLSFVRKRVHPPPSKSRREGPAADQARPALPIPTAPAPQPSKSPVSGPPAQERQYKSRARDVPPAPRAERPPRPPRAADA